MVKFEVIIAQLLLKHDCVIVPQLGGFVTFYKSAVIHPINNSIQPPSKQLGFNRHLTTGDGLLLNNYVKSSGEALPKAQAHLEQWTQQILNHLANGQKAHLDGIGTLWTDAQGQMQFVPSEKFITDFTSFGLGNIVLPAKNQLPTGIQASKTAWKKLAAAASVAVLLATGLFVFQHNTQNTDTAGWNPELTAPSVQKSERPTVPSISTEPGEQNFQKEFLNLWNAEPIAVAQLVTNTVEKTETRVEQVKAVQPVITERSTSNKTNAEWGKSWVVGGVFKSRENAQEQVSAMKTQGFANAKVIPFQDYFYAVYGTAKNDKDEAQLRAKVLTVDPRAWTKR
jgi:hypothetical protein